jgi:hypothetical protein
MADMRFWVLQTRMSWRVSPISMRFCFMQLLAFSFSTIQLMLHD